jgi:hypothetical protein
MLYPYYIVRLINIATVYCRMSYPITDRYIDQAVRETEIHVPIYEKMLVLQFYRHHITLASLSYRRTINYHTVDLIYTMA